MLSEVLYGKHLTVLAFCFCLAVLLYSFASKLVTYLLTFVSVKLWYLACQSN